jgi:hypothetical protein
MKRTLYAVLLLAACLSLASVSDRYCGDLTVGDVLGIEPPAIAASIAADTVPEITGPDSIPAGKPAWFAVTGVSGTASAAFLPTALLDTDPSRVVAGSALFWVAAPGEYVLTAIVVDWDARRFTPLSKQVTVTGKDPSPNPPVPPTPTPTPGDRWVLIVSETNQPTVEHRQLLTELRTSNQFPRLWIVDPDPARADPAVAPYLSGLDAGDKPQIIIIAEDKDKAGVVLYRGDCPATAAEVAYLLRRHGG